MAIPGLAVILVLKNAVLRGRRPAVATALGVLSADLIWATASVVGLTALLVSSQAALDVVRAAGAAYLFYLGDRLLLTPTSDPALDQPTLRPRRVTSRRAFGKGFLCDLSNPKTVLVFASVIPQSLATASPGPNAVILGVVLALLGFGCLIVYALVLGRARAFLGGQSRGTSFAVAAGTSCSLAWVCRWSDLRPESRPIAGTLITTGSSLG